jgi:ribose 5-phosphate isomerase B
MKKKKTLDIAIASDHAGLELKWHLVRFLLKQGHNVIDMGVRRKQRVDYPVYAKKVAEAVSEDEALLGILICGSGIGMSMAANRYPGVRAALAHDHFTARLARSHNNANILVLGGRVIAKELAEELVTTWLETPFEGGRHQQRLDMLDETEA